MGNEECLLDGEDVAFIAVSAPAEEKGGSFVSVSGKEMGAKLVLLFPGQA